MALDIPERLRAAELQKLLGIGVQASEQGYAIVDYDALYRLAQERDEIEAELYLHRLYGDAEQTEKVADYIGRRGLKPHVTGPGAAALLDGDLPDPTEVDQPPHTRSERGFVQMDPFVCTYGTKVRVSESSAAEHAHIWLALEQGHEEYPGGLERSEAHAHLSLKKAKQLRDQLDWLIENHYHHDL